MILVDTSVWIDHFKAPQPKLLKLLKLRLLYTHPVVIGELLVGGLPDRLDTLPFLWRLRGAKQATHDESVLLITRHELLGRGIGYGDVQLLASVLLTRNARLWTRDRKLEAVADELGIAAHPTD